MGADEVELVARVRSICADPHAPWYGSDLVPLVADVCDAIESLAARVAVLEADGELAIKMLANWCDAVENNGTGWDDWDEHYKNAAYRPCRLRAAIDAARGAGRE